ncbi:MAG: type II toxin-antitoxin system RelE/ParE family toxin [Candidatus Electrothrix sp. AUS4]|nr:type II toxin-antitoxin system RelE/ParE family toxin [Candidatus Electrothrix sp. AUS4]
MNNTVHLQPDAEIDIEEAAAWYELQRKRLGHEFLDEVLSTFSQIEDNPYIYPVVYRNIRRAVMSRFPFAVYYLLNEEAAVVIAVMHGSRHPARWRKRI